LGLLPGSTNSRDSQLELPRRIQLEFDLREREEWYSQNTAATSVVHSGQSQFDTRDEVSVSLQPIDQQLTLRGSYSEGFHAPQLFGFRLVNPELPCGYDPFSSQTDVQVEERQIGNPNLRPESLMNGPTDSFTARNGSRAWTIAPIGGISTCDRLRRFSERQFIIEHNLPGLVQRAPTAFLVNLANHARHRSKR